MPSPPTNIARRRRWPWLLAALPLLAALALWLLPFGLEAGLERWLRGRGAEVAEVGDVDFNPFAGLLVIRELDARGGGRTLSAREASLDLDWWPLRQRRVEVRGVALAGAVIDLAREADGAFAVGPLVFGGEQGEAPPAAEEKAAWGWAVREARLEDVRVGYSDGRLQEEVGIARLRVAGLSSWEPDGASAVEAALQVAGGTLEIVGTARPFAPERTVAARIRAADLHLDRLRPLLQEEAVRGLSGRLDLASDASATLAEDGALQAAVRGRLAARELRGTTAAVAVAGGDLSWDGSVDLQRGEALALQVAGVLEGGKLDLTLPGPGQRVRQQQLRLRGEVRLQGGAETTVEVEGAVDGRGLTVDDRRRGRNAATVEALAVEKIRFAGGALSASGVQLRGAALLQRPEGAEGAGHTLTLAEATLDRLEVVPGQGIALGALALSGGDLLLARDAEGLELQAWLERPAGDAPPETKTEAEAEEPAPLKLAAVTLNDCRLQVVDATLTPPYREAVESIGVELKEVDSRAPDHPSPLKVEARIGRYAKLSAEGTVQPFAPRPTLRLAGRVEGFDLPSLNPYTVSLLDYRLNKGHLDTRFKAGVEQGVIDAEIRLTAGKLELEPLREGEKNRFRKLLGMPVSYALSLLRDRQDNIKIRIPVSGDISDPKLRLADILTRAVRTGLQKAAVSYYAPLGVTLLTGVILPPGTLFVAGKAVEWVTTMRFQPVAFDPGGDLLGAKGAAYLEKTAELVKDRPDVRLVLCGRAAAADLAALRGERKKGGPAEATEEERRQLEELARRRAHAVKDRLISLGVAADRLLICEPEVRLDSEPIVEISG